MRIHDPDMNEQLSVGYLKYGTATLQSDACEQMNNVSSLIALFSRVPHRSGERIVICFLFWGSDCELISKH
jgi:hypothetical protein